MQRPPVPPSDPIVRARGLTKRYGSLTAVRGIDFDVWPQECFGMLGPNGAGKTTTIRMLYGFVHISEGELELMGMDARSHWRVIKGRLGIVPQEDNLDPDLTVLENLIVYARYFDIPRKVALERARESLELFQLWERRRSPIMALSGGMKRRLIVARSLINQPSMLILDEPTTGLDPQARHLVWTKLRQLKQRGVTMLLTTHYMDEAAQLCDRLVIMDEGRILDEGSPAELVERHVGRQVVELRVPEESHRIELRQRLEAEGLPVEDSGDTVYVLSGDSHGLEEGLDRGRVTAVIRRQATLEDVFLRLTGHALRE